MMSKATILLGLIIFISMAQANRFLEIEESSEVNDKYEVTDKTIEHQKDGEAEEKQDNILLTPKQEEDSQIPSVQNEPSENDNSVKEDSSSIPLISNGEDTQTEQNVEKEEIKEEKINDPIIEDQSKEEEEKVVEIKQKTSENEPLIQNNTDWLQVSIWFVITMFVAIFFFFVGFYRYNLQKYRVPPFSPPSFCPVFLFPRPENDLSSDDQLYQRELGIASEAKYNNLL